MMHPFAELRQAVHDDLSLVALKGAIILMGLLFIVLALTINNKWLLAGVFAYGALP